MVNEGEAQRYFDHALILKNTIQYLRNNKNLCIEDDSTAPGLGKVIFFICVSLPVCSLKYVKLQIIMLLRVTCTKDNIWLELVGWVGIDLFLAVYTYTHLVFL